MSLTAVAEALSERYAGKMNRPDVSVLIQDFGGQRAYVGGEVEIPRMLPLDAVTNVADAIFAAGGFRETAAMDSVILLRRADNEAGFEAFCVDLHAGLYGEAPLPMLEPFDVVFVPKTRIAQLNHYVEMYINRIVPQAASFGVTYGIGF